MLNMLYIRVTLTRRLRQLSSHAPSIIVTSTTAVATVGRLLNFVCWLTLNSTQLRHIVLL